MRLINLLDSELSWKDSDRWAGALALTEKFFRENKGNLSIVAEKARAVKELIDRVDPFIQKNTSEVCPHCEKVCCMNKHGYYDYEDVIYIYALGLEPPEYREGICDTDSCQFISPQGCTLDRSLRPNRCNWYFCNPLVDHMEEGPGRAYREFNNDFQEAINTKKEMLDEFFRALRSFGA